MTTNPFLVSTDWLYSRLGDDNISIVDASWYLPTMLANGKPRNGKAEYDTQHIPGAVFFDIDEITEPGSTLPHTLASPEVFAQKVGALGISDQDTIVVYDGMGLFSAARAWWNFRVMGAVKVVILDGGLPQWIADRLPIEAGNAPVHPKLFTASFDPTSVVSLSRMQEILDNEAMQVADARPAGRFSGQDPEPRPGVRSGHMKGAHSVPFSEISRDGRLLAQEELRTVFSNAGVDLGKPVATTCGSGVTAAALTLALETIGHTDHVLYDGSWAEWGTSDHTKVVKDD